MTPRNPAGYVRLSVTTEESVSVEGQVRMIYGEAERRGWPRPTIFTDDGVSGSKDIARPERDDLERRVGLGEFDAVMVKSVDRLARSVLDFHRIAATATRRGAVVVVIEAGLDTSTASGKMMLGILAQFAEFEAATIAARVTAANVGIRKAGRTRGGPVPYGLRNATIPDRPGMYRVLDDEEAAVVLRMVEELLAGASLRAIALGLERDGIPTPRVRDALAAGREADPAPWSYTAVRRILSNPSIAGMERALGDVIRDADGLRRVNGDAAIIDVSTFRSVQAALRDRGDGNIRRTRHADRPLLDGLVFCSTCLGPMRRVSTKGHVSYGCSNASKGKCAARTTVAATTLDTHVVLNFLDTLGSNVRTRTERVDDGVLSDRLVEIRAEIADTVASFATAATADIAGLAERLTSLRASEAQALLAVDAKPLSTLVSTGQTWSGAWAATSDVVERRGLLSEAIDRVIVRKPLRRGEPIASRALILTGQEDVPMTS